MKVTVIRFSRPLLLMSNMNDYTTIFGCVMEDKNEVKGDEQYTQIRNYVGYLCGLADWANGGEEFTVSFQSRGVPDWVDSRGIVHYKQDDWMDKIGRKCMKKLNLNYTVSTLDIDRETLYHYVNHEDLVVDESFFYEYDELPF